MELKNNVYLTTFYSGNVLQLYYNGFIPFCVYTTYFTLSVAAFGKVIVLNKEENFSDK